MGGALTPLTFGGSTAAMERIGELLKVIFGVDATNPAEIDRVRKLPDAEKIALLDNAFEMAGGTVGAMAGSGVASIPAAGAGAVAGRSASHLLAKGLGLKETPQSVGQEVIDTATTFATNAGGEALGRAIPTAIRAGKTAIGNAVKAAVKPTPEANALKAIADKYGVTLNLGQRSGRPFVQSMEVALDRNPITTETIRNTRKSQFGQYEKAVNDWLNQIHNGQINTEEFARLAEDTMSRLQKDFSGRVGAGAKAAAQQLSPKPVSNLEAGAALKSGLDANVAAVSKWADQAYGNLRTKHGGNQIDATPLGDAAQALLDEIPPGQLQNIFPPRALRLLNAANVKPVVEEATAAIPSLYDDIAKSQGGVLYGHLDENGQQSVKRIAESMGAAPLPPAPTPTSTPPQISMSEAMQTRSELLKRASKSTDKNEQRYLHTLADSINDSMEQSLSKTPGAEKAFKELQGLNTQYRGFMEKLRPPAGPGRKGSVAAATIQNHPIPEQLPPQVSASETMLQQARDAVSPETTKAIGGTGPDPMQPLRRNRFDAMVEGATIEDPSTGYSRISPTRFSEALPPKPAMEGLYGTQLPPVAGIGKPKLVEREQLLFNSPLPRAAGSGGNAMNTYNAAFPKHGFSGQVDDTMKLFEEVGRTPQAQRGFAEGLMEQSQRRNPTISDTELLSPRVLETNIRKYGETAPRVLGQQNMRSMGELTELGKGLTQAEVRLGNPSGTARASENISFGKRLFHPGEWPSLAKEAALSTYGADRFSDPTKYNWMLDPPEKLIPQFGSTTSGAIGRAAVSALPPKASSSEDDFGPTVNEDHLGSVVDEEDNFGPVVKATPAAIRKQP